MNKVIIECKKQVKCNSRMQIISVSEQKMRAISQQNYLKKNAPSPKKNKNR
ncbi:hypothetical protein EPIR_3810 [Erwinia piriflorinigrans CFBP 5888]|uniref:Uncharacterized protein n=1 Tax=Erwinia piriflorinigrans CFBP 5888 TaxID=1161919 RepID=V5ZCS1_9GAMM|nr:hypothetical protein EPIR_3810 [Erwinia piriflorinigrans CFBP 5888]